MSIIFEERPADSPFVETITHGWTISDGSPIRPAECNWHMVIVKHSGDARLLLVGPWATSGIVNYAEGAEILWIRFKLGTFMPHLPTQKLLNSEIILPNAVNKAFWLNSSAWQFPDFENADVFIDKLVRAEVLVYDPVVSAVLDNAPQDIADRTVRHRFLRSTGLTQNHIFQVERAKQAATLLRQGKSILDTVYEAGYFDQPHLTRALKQWIGYTPAQIIKMGNSD
jgi:Helix-turn-helix domain